MKKLLLALVICLVLVGVMAAPVMAAKPVDNTAGAVKVNWNLSGAVMPVPPYGSLDKPGSDTASSLIVNRPMGNTQATITGQMKGLASNTEYTVYLANGYTKYVPASIQSTWVADMWIGGAHAAYYDINLAIGTAGYPAGSPSYSYTWSGITYSITYNTFSLTATYDACADPAAAGCVTHMTGIIAGDGSISGNWDDNYPSMTGSRTGTWTAPAGTAVPYSGSTGFPGTISSFTFTTNPQGIATWHVNVKTADLAGSSSIWINGGGATILISDPF